MTSFFELEAHIEEKLLDDFFDIAGEETTTPKQIQKFINAGIDINTHDRLGCGYNALMYAVENEKINMEVLKFLLKAGTDINATDWEGQTALKVAVEFNDNIEITKFLIDSGFDVNTSDDGGWTPLITATFKKKVDFIKLLLQAGADPNAKNNKGMTAKDFAIKGGIPEIVKIFESLSE